MSEQRPQRSNTAPDQRPQGANADLYQRSAALRREIARVCDRSGRTTYAADALAIGLPAESAPAPTPKGSAQADATTRAAAHLAAILDEVEAAVRDDPATLDWSALMARSLADLRALRACLREWPD